MSGIEIHCGGGLYFTNLTRQFPHSKKREKNVKKNLNVNRINVRKMFVRRKKQKRKMVKHVIRIQSALVISVTGVNVGLLPVWTKKLYAKKIQIVAV